MILLMNDLVINSYKNINNSNNYKIEENNIVESDTYTTEIILDDTNKINDIEKRTTENQTGKLVVNNNKKKKVLIFGYNVV